jgi:hypothetical protein
MPVFSFLFRRRLPRIRGTQIGLREPPLVDRLKADMRAGQFFYHEDRGRIGGVRDRRGTYYVVEGHHRMAAAMELYRETGDTTYVLTLIEWGKWDPGRGPPDRWPPFARAGLVGRLSEPVSLVDTVNDMSTLRLECDGVTIASVTVPPFRLHQGEVLCLHTPVEVFSAAEEQMAAALTGERPVPGIHLHGRAEWARPPHGARYGLAGLFRPVKVVDWLCRSAGVTAAEAERITRRLGLPADARLSQLPGTPRNLLALEAAWARGAEVLLFSDVALDPLGSRATFEAVARLRERCAALYLSHLYYTQGRLERQCFPQARCLELSRRPAAPAPLLERQG